MRLRDSLLVCKDFREDDEMNKRCKFRDASGHLCGSYAFNLEKEGLDQGDFCDRHYWQDECEKARAEVDKLRAESVAVTPA